jgi:hypothetical protein
MSGDRPLVCVHGCRARWEGRRRARDGMGCDGAGGRRVAVLPSSSEGQPSAVAACKGKGWPIGDVESSSATCRSLVAWKVAASLVPTADAPSASVGVPLGQLATTVVVRRYRCGRRNAGIVAFARVSPWPVSGCVRDGCRCGRRSPFPLHTGAWRELAGANGEDSTRGELRIARRRRRIWGWIDSLEVRGGDVDHLVVTSVGLLVIDSKWHTSDLNAALLHADAAAAHRAARLARLILRSLGLTDLQIQPAVVVWGGAQSSLGHQVRIDGVEFVGGADLQRWLTLRASGSLTSRRATDVLTRLRQFKVRVDPTRNPRQSRPPHRTAGNRGPGSRTHG